MSLQEKIIARLEKCFGLNQTTPKQLTSRRKPSPIERTDLNTIIRHISRIVLIINQEDESTILDTEQIARITKDLQNYIEHLQTENQENQEINNLLFTNLKVEHGVRHDYNLHTQIDLITRYLINPNTTLNNLSEAINLDGTTKYRINSFLCEEISRIFINLQSLETKSNIIQKAILEKLIESGANTQKIQPLVNSAISAFNTQVLDYQLSQLDLLNYTKILQSHLEHFQKNIDDTAKKENSKLASMIIQLELIKSSLNSEYIHNLHHRTDYPSTNRYIAPYVLSALNIYYTIISLQFNTIIKETS